MLLNEPVPLWGLQVKTSNSDKSTHSLRLRLLCYAQTRPQNPPSAQLSVRMLSACQYRQTFLLASCAGVGMFVYSAEVRVSEAFVLWRLWNWHWSWTRELSCVACYIYLWVWTKIIIKRPYKQAVKLIIEKSWIWHTRCWVFSSYKSLSIGLKNWDGIRSMLSFSKLAYFIFTIIWYKVCRFVTIVDIIHEIQDD
jgi:hypothetical protein